MRLLHVSDIHQGDVSLLREIVKKEKPDLVIFTGDVGIYDWGKEDLEAVEPILEELNSLDVKVLAIPGNHDETEKRPVLRRLLKKYSNIIDLHKNRFDYKGFSFVGYGLSDRIAIERLCGGYIGAMTPGVFEPKKARNELKKLLKGVDPKKTILLTHIPPMGDGTTDFNLYGYHNGSEVLADILKESGLALALCGDIHEGRGVEKLGKTTVVNAGSFGYDNSYAIIDLNSDKLKVDLK